MRKEKLGIALAYPALLPEFYNLDANDSWMLKLEELVFFQP